MPGSADFQFTQQAVGNTSQLFGTEWIKDDDFIQAAHQFGPEIILGFLYRLFAAAGALGLRSGKTQRGCLPGQAAGTQVGSEQDNGVGKIRPPPLGIGQRAALQDLQQQILNVAVRFFNLVKQHHAVGAAADFLGQLAGLLVAHIARRRADHPGDSVLLHIFGHVKAQQGFLTAEPAFGQCAGQLCFAHAGGT